MRFWKIISSGALAATTLLATGWTAGAQEPQPLKIGIVTFLSGGAAGPFGVPARNAAELVVSALNEGTVPAPHNTKGIAGATVQTVIVDEAGGAQTQVTEYRNLVEREGVDLVIGYISSGDCNAVAPVAEELQRLTVFFDCGTPQVFEEIVTAPKYLFRTGADATMDNVAAARYLMEAAPDTSKIAGINQNYAWGQDSWRDFAASVKTLKPEAEVAAEQFPQIYAGQYGAEISALLTAAPDVVHSSFWGGDMEALVFQGAPRGLFEGREVILTAGETAMYRLGEQMPDGTIIGARGPHGVFAPESELNTWFRKQYFDRYGTWPTYPSYKMAQAIFGVKAAYEKAAGGQAGALPTQDEVIAAFENLEFEGPSGTVRMANANGHQAVQETAYGRYKYDREKGEPTLVEVTRYAAECVNAPPGVKNSEWIQSGFEGAGC